MTDPRREMMSPALAAERVAAGLAARRTREKRFRLYGRIAIGIALIHPIKVIIEKRGTGTPAWMTETSRGGDISHRAITIVA